MKCSQGAAESHRTLVQQVCAAPLLCSTYPSVCNQRSSTATKATSRTWPNTLHVLQSSEEIMESNKSYRKAARLAQPGQQKKHGWIPGQGKRFISSPGHPDRLWDPSSLLFSGYSGSFPWSKAQHSPPPNAEVKNEGSYTTIITIRLHGMHKGRKQSDCYNLNTNLHKTKDAEERNLLLNCPSAVS